MKLKNIFLKTIGKFIPSDLFAARFPVSVKGICFIDGQVILIKNERSQWDLPGGKLNRKETLRDCLKREIQEELGIEVMAKRMIDTTMIRVMNTIDVIIVLYSCTTLAKIQELQLGQENFGIGLFSPDQLTDLRLPTAYQKAIAIASNASS